MIKFNFFFSLSFWVLFLAVAVVFRFLAPHPRVRGLFLFASSTFMILSIPQFSLWHYVAVVFGAAMTFVIGRCLNASPDRPARRWRKAAAAFGLSGVLFFLALFKYRGLQALVFSELKANVSGTPSFVFLIGVSYFSFKMMHFLIEAYRRKIENPNPLDYLNYILFFPAFISGPISRYNQFASQLKAPPPVKPSRDLREGLERIIHGLFKKLVIVQLLMPYILKGSPTASSPTTVLGLLGGLYAYALYFYFDFSGYTDLAIGSARILGLELPENFRSPLLRRNIRELWMNWHMSLTSWLVDYIYWPLVRKLRNFEFFRRRPISLSNLGMIVTFVACGMWHGETPNFLLWGLYHGLGISVVNIYQRGKRTVKNEALQKYFASPASRLVGTVATFNFFALGLSLFVLQTDQLVALIRNLKF